MSRILTHDLILLCLILLRVIKHHLLLLWRNWLRSQAHRNWNTTAYNPVLWEHTLFCPAKYQVCSYLDWGIHMRLSQSFYSCTNIMTKKQLREERVYSAYTSKLLLITKERQDWNSSRSGSRSWCRGHRGMLLTGLLPMACSACSLVEPYNTSQKMVPLTIGPLP